MKAAGIVFLVLMTGGQLVPADRPDLPRASRTLLISGELGFTGQGGDLYQRSTTATFTPSLSVMVARGLALGATLDISATGIRDYGSTTTLAFGPRLSWFLPSLTGTKRIPGSIYPFFTAGIRFISDSATNGFHQAATGYRIPLAAGLAVMVSRSTGLFIKGFYSLDHLQDEDTGTDSGGSRYGLTAGFGLFRYRSPLPAGKNRP
jgi:hypothetical protein